MKHITNIITALLIVAPITALASETVPSPPEDQVQAMSRLHHWIGQWHGEGWTSTGPGQRRSFRITETVAAKIASTVLFVEGRGTTTTDDGDKLVTHDAVGLLSWDSEQKRYNFRTHDLRGRARDATLELDRNGRMQWGFRDEDSNALLRFEIHIEDDTWHQTGRISPNDGENWYPMLEMTLQRQSSTGENACP